MNSSFRFLSLLAFSLVLVQFSQAQSRVSGAQIDAPFLQAEVQDGALESSGELQATPVLHAFQNPGERSIHVHMAQLMGISNMQITLLGPNARVVNNRNVYICTLCGTFDIDLDDEIAVGRHHVIVEIGSQVITRTIWVE